MYGKERIYKQVEIIGEAGSIEAAAIETALAKAQSSLGKLSWFEAQEVRGHIGPDGKVTEYQVALKVSFEFNKYRDRVLISTAGNLRINTNHPLSDGSLPGFWWTS